MRSTATRSSALALVLLATGALAHPRGFHKKVTLTVTRSKLTALVVLDGDEGNRCQELREAADADGNGVLQGAEVTKLKERLVRIATSRLEVKLSGAKLPLVPRESKLSLREDPRADEGGLSLAVLFELKLSTPAAEGMQLEVTDVAPDESAVAVEVFQAGAKEAPFQQEVPSGRPATVRLGRLAER